MKPLLNAPRTILAILTGCTLGFCAQHPAPAKPVLRNTVTLRPSETPRVAIHTNEYGAL